MQSALHIKATVLPGKRIEVTVPELTEGEAIDVFLVLPQAAAPARRSMLELLEALPPGGPRLFKTPQDADRYLQEERDSWDR